MSEQDECRTTEPACEPCKHCGSTDPRKHDGAQHPKHHVFANWGDQIHVLDEKSELGRYAFRIQALENTVRQAAARIEYLEREREALRESLGECIGIIEARCVSSDDEAFDVVGRASSTLTAQIGSVQP